MIKKLICVLLVLAMTLSFVSCQLNISNSGKKTDTSDLDSDDTTETKRKPSSETTTAKDETEEDDDDETTSFEEYSESEESESEETEKEEPEDEDPPEIVVPKATVDQTCIYLFAGDTYELNYTLEDSTANPDDVVWVSSREDCVSVENGIINAKKDGYSCVSAGNDTYCLVNVLPAEMPTLKVDTNYQSINSNYDYTPCAISVSTENDYYCFENITGGIRLRGNSTSGYDKKPYRIKFDEKQNILGMNGGAECRSWVLLADYLDDTKLRNMTALSMASFMLEEYSSDWRYVTLEINGEYQGVYILCEQNQINQNRIDIEEAGVDSQENESGYLLEIDASWDNSKKFEIDYSGLDIYTFQGSKYTIQCNDSGVYKLFVSVKNNGISDDQFHFVEKAVKNIFNIIYQATYQNKRYVLDENYDLVENSSLTAEEAISRVVDIESAVRMYLLCELMCNSDDYKKSFYFWIDFSDDGKLTFGCPWDYDGAIVEWSTYNYQDTSKYYAANRNLWFVMMMTNEWFRNKVKDCWQEIYENNDEFSHALSMVSKVSEIYADDFRKDMTKWGKRAWDSNNHFALTYTWLTERVKWLNEEFGKK